MKSVITGLVGLVVGVAIGASVVGYTYQDYINRIPVNPLNGCYAMNLTPNFNKSTTFLTYDCGTNPDLAEIIIEADIIYFDGTTLSIDKPYIYYVSDKTGKYDVWIDLDRDGWNGNEYNNGKVDFTPNTAYGTPKQKE